MLVTYKQIAVLEQVGLKEKIHTLETTLGSMKEEKTNQNQSRLCKTLTAVAYHFYYKVTLLIFVLFLCCNCTEFVSV